MKASRSDQLRLLDLQQIDTVIARTERSIANPPQAAELSDLDDQLVQSDRTVLERLGAVDDLRTALVRVQDDTGVVEQRRDRNQQRLVAGADAKTSQAIEHENATLDRRRGELEDQQLELMQQQEDAEEALRAAREDAEAVRSRRDQLAATRDAELEVLRTKLGERQREREVLAVALPGDLVTLYDKQRARYGFGATLLQGRMSVSAGVELTASELAEVSRAAVDDVLMCPTSNAILVRSEESGL